MTMREILFRAKRIDNGEWVEGYLFDDGMAEVEHYFVGRIVVEPYKGTACDDWDITGIDFCEVDPETLCQYTGLRDKNGNRIWENDIITLYAGEYRAVVVWNPACGRWDISCVKGSYMRIPMGKWKPIVIDRTTKYWKEYTESYDFIVDGNIFDNPELLKGERGCTLR